MMREVLPRQSVMLGLLLVAGLTAATWPSCSLAGDDKASDVQAVLKARDFWDTVGKQGGKKWSEAEQTQLEELSLASKDPVVGLRAMKITSELAGQARHNVGNDDATIAVAGFRYLEANLKNAQVKKLLKERITHYHVSLNTTEGSIWLLLESVGKKQSGGLNLRWDADSKSIVEMVAWGSVK